MSIYGDLFRIVYKVVRVPRVSSIVNNGSEGKFIFITFTEDLIGSVTGNKVHFTISWKEYNHVPDGVLIDKSYYPTDIYLGDTDSKLILEMQSYQRFNNAVGDITVSYDGLGTLQGQFGKVAAFEESFTPTGLIAKPNPNNSEHLEISNVSKTSVLTRVYHSEYRNNPEHISIDSTSWTGTLIDVNDL